MGLVETLKDVAKLAQNVTTKSMKFDECLGSTICVVVQRVNYYYVRMDINLPFLIEIDSY